MIKGVNKNIIEIVSTENDCFERAILFVRPDSMGKEGEELHRSAKNYLRGLKLRPRMIPGRKHACLGAVKLLAAVGAGAAAAVLLIK